MCGGAGGRRADSIKGDLKGLWLRSRPAAASIRPVPQLPDSDKVGECAYSSSPPTLLLPYCCCHCCRRIAATVQISKRDVLLLQEHDLQRASNINPNVGLFANKERRAMTSMLYRQDK